MKGNKKENAEETEFLSADMKTNCYFTEQFHEL